MQPILCWTATVTQRPGARYVGHGRWLFGNSHRGYECCRPDRAECGRMGEQRRSRDACDISAGVLQAVENHALEVRPWKSTHGVSPGKPDSVEATAWKPGDGK